VWQLFGGGGFLRRAAILFPTVRCCPLGSAPFDIFTSRWRAGRFLLQRLLPPCSQQVMETIPYTIAAPNGISG